MGPISEVLSHEFDCQWFHLFPYAKKFSKDNKEPLFGRADNIIKLSAFSLSVLKEIMHEYAPTHSNDDLLALYTFTGGVPKYVELFCDNHTLHVESMIHFMARDNSPFTEEGKNLLYRRNLEKLRNLLF